MYRVRASTTASCEDGGPDRSMVLVVIVIGIVGVVVMTVHCRRWLLTYHLLDEGLWMWIQTYVMSLRIEVSEFNLAMAQALKLERSRAVPEPSKFG
jgi:hypothetical protein